MLSPLVGCLDEGAQPTQKRMLDEHMKKHKLENQDWRKLMSMVELRMAVVHHYWNHRDLELEIFEGVRKTYDGPLTMAHDLTVLNVKKDHLEVREVTFNHEACPQGTSKE